MLIYLYFSLNKFSCERVNLHHCLTHCDLVIPHGDRSGQLRLRQWLVAWWHQAIIWNDVDFLPERLCDYHLRAISRWVTNLLFCITSSKIILLKLLPHHPGDDEFICDGALHWLHPTGIQQKPVWILLWLLKAVCTNRKSDGPQKSELFIWRHKPETVRFSYDKQCSGDQKLRSIFWW